MKKYRSDTTTRHFVDRRSRGGEILSEALSTQAAKQLAERCLLIDRFVLTVDHRFSPNKPALLSAAPNKSFYSVSSPIFACSDFRPIAGVAGPLSAADPHHARLECRSVVPQRSSAHVLSCTAAILPAGK